MKNYTLNLAHRLPSPIKKMLLNSRNLFYQKAINKIRQKQYPNVNFNPIIIYQMGKVGSSTVEQSLNQAYENLDIRIPIYRRHILNNFDRHEEIARKHRPNIEDTNIELREGRLLRDIIDKNQSTRWKLISLVREPLSRTIAAFFQLLHEFFPNWEKQFKDGDLTIDDLHGFFQSNMLGFDPSGWFDAQINAVFGIDVFAESFPTKAGYKIFSNQKADLLLFRLENLDTCAEKAVREFLGIENFSLLNTNIGKEKKYAKLYKEFRNKPFPLDYVTRWYDTRYAKHFYNEEERSKFIKRWADV